MTVSTTLRVRPISAFLNQATRTNFASSHRPCAHRVFLGGTIQGIKKEQLVKPKITQIHSKSFSSSTDDDNPTFEDPNGPKPNERPYATQFTNSATTDSIAYKPIATAQSPFLERHGVPRQPLTEGSRGETSGSFTLLPSNLGGVEKAQKMLQDLDNFSHIIVLAHLHLNTGWNAQVIPPRLRKDSNDKGGSRKKGLFATRAPHRPNNIGLSVLEVKSVDVENYTIYVHHTDLIHGTPILDIKPYIRQYDSYPTATSGWIDDIQEEESSNQPSPIPEEFTKSYHLTGVGQKSSTTITTNTGHELKTDVPIKMGGQDGAPQPIEHLLSALAGCTQATALYVGRCMNPRLLIDKIEFDLYAERDERGALTRPIEDVPEMPSRLQVVRGTIRIYQKGGKNIGEDVIEILKEQTENRCPVANMMLASGCMMDVRWVDGMKEK